MVNKRKALPPSLTIKLGKWVWTTLWQTMMSKLAPRNTDRKLLICFCRPAMAPDCIKLQYVSPWVQIIEVCSCGLCDCCILFRRAVRIDRPRSFSEHDEIQPICLHTSAMITSIIDSQLLVLPRQFVGYQACANIQRTKV